MKQKQSISFTMLIVFFAAFTVSAAPPQQDTAKKNPDTSATRKILARQMELRKKNGLIKPAPIPRFSVKGDGTLQDNLTDLIWAQDAKTPGPEACKPGKGKTWQAALDYVKCLNTNRYLGFTDWRLPNVSELDTLVDRSVHDQAVALNAKGFTGSQSDFYWSSSTLVNNPSRAWGVYMNFGVVYHSDKSIGYHVWPVRGVRQDSGKSVTGSPGYVPPRTGQVLCYDPTGTVTSCPGTGQDGEKLTGAVLPDPRFTDKADGTARDNLTGRLWTKDANAPGPAKCKPGVQKTWAEALAYVDCLNKRSYLGHDDWLLPDPEELRSLINYSQSTPSEWHNTHDFTNVQPDYYWSSSSLVANPASAWLVSMSGGHVYVYAKSYGFYVWPVRGGQ